MCIRVGKVQCRPWASPCEPFQPCPALSLHSTVYTLHFPETRLTKHLKKEKEESISRRTGQHKRTHTQTHTPPSHISSLFLSLFCLWPLVVACLNPRGLSPVEPVMLWRLRFVMQHKHTAACERTSVQVDCSIPPTQSPPRPHERLKLKTTDNSRQRRHLWYRLLSVDRKYRIT